MAKSTANTISWNKVLIENFDITKPEDNERIPAQKLSYIRYKNKGRSGQLYMKTPRIHMTSGGIPQEGPFYPNDQKRAKGFKIPFTKETTEEADFYTKMKELDEYFSSEEFKRDVLGWSDKTAATYDYVPIVRTPQEMDDDDDEEEDEEEDEEKAKAKKALKEKREKMGPRPDYMKPFFELEYQTNKVLVKILHKSGEEKIPVEDVNVLDDALKYITWNGFAKYILTPNKLYATKQKDNKTGKKTYGVTWKVICVEAEPSEKAGGKQELPDDPFISDDEDEEFQATAKKITKMDLKEVEEVEQVDYGTVDEAAEEAAEEEEEEEEVQQVKPKSKAKAAPKEEVVETKTKSKKSKAV
jgi:hypothetical protein